MRTYCSLVIFSDVDNNLETTTERILGLTSADVQDTHSPSMVKNRLELARISGTIPITPPRYFWRLTSLGQVKSINIEEHLAWLFLQIRPNAAIQDILAFNCNAYIICFYSHAGRGGGPVLPPPTLLALAKHGVDLKFDFYVEDANVLH